MAVAYLSLVVVVVHWKPIAEKCGCHHVSADGMSKNAVSAFPQIELNMLRLTSTISRLLLTVHWLNQPHGWLPWAAVKEQTKGSLSVDQECTLSFHSSEIKPQFVSAWFELFPPPPFLSFFVFLSLYCFRFILFLPNSLLYVLSFYHHLFLSPFHIERTEKVALVFVCIAQGQVHFTCNHEGVLKQRCQIWSKHMITMLCNQSSWDGIAHPENFVKC